MPSEPCRYFRTKRMFANAPAPIEPAREPEANPHVHCWCNQTQTEVGLDDHLVGPVHCSLPRRACFERR